MSMFSPFSSHSSVATPQDATSNAQDASNTSQDASNASRGRIEALDFLKGCFVLLMVAFHLAYFADGYPLLKQWVYTFHMPGFLLISGYLMRVNRSWQLFARTLLWLAVPYLVLESGYIVTSAFLPVRERIEHLTLSVFCEKLFLHPLGPYWYLHTLILCGAAYFSVWKTNNMGTLSRLIALAIPLSCLSVMQLVAWDVSLYFFLGVVVRQSGVPFLQIFRSSWWAFIGLAWLAFFPETFHKGSLGGVATVYLVIAALLTIFGKLPHRLRSISLFLGRNSLAIYLFSPIFTMLCKVLIPFVAFDTSRLLFLSIALPFSVVGALGVCKILDFLHLSPWLFGKKSALQ